MVAPLQRRARDGSARGHGAGGFTLIEILLAITVVMVAMGTILVNLDGLTLPERIRAASRKLAGMSDFIRSQAAGTKIKGYFDIDFDHNQYRWRMDPPKDQFGRYIDPDEERILTRDEIDEWAQGYQWEELPRGVYFDKLWFNSKQFYDKDYQWIEYRPDGTVSSYVLWLKAAESEDEELQFSILVNGLTGKSEVKKGHWTMAEATDTDFKMVIGDGVPGGGG